MRNKKNKRCYKKRIKVGGRKLEIKEMEDKRKVEWVEEIMKKEK